MIQIHKYRAIITMPSRGAQYIRPNFVQLMPPAPPLKNPPSRAFPIAQISIYINRNVRATGMDSSQTKIANPKPFKTVSFGFSSHAVDPPVHLLRPSSLPRVASSSSERHTRHLHPLVVFDTRLAADPRDQIALPCLSGPAPCLACPKAHLPLHLQDSAAH